MPAVDNWEANPDAKADFKEINILGREFSVIINPHYSIQAADMFRKQVKPRITNPDEWGFFVEEMYGNAPETTAITDFVLKSKEPLALFDPIIPPTLGAFSKIYPKFGFETDTEKGLVLGVFADAQRRETGVTDLQQLAKDMAADPEEIKLALEMIEERRRDPRFKQIEDNIWEKALVVSNIISAQVIKYYLDKYLSIKKGILLIAPGHKQVLDLLKSGINIQHRLSKEVIEELVKQKRLSRIGI